MVDRITWKEIFFHLRGKRKNDQNLHLLKQLEQKDKPMPENLFGDKTYKDHIIKWHWMQYVFKYRFFEPFLWIIKKLFKKKIEEDIPDTPWNKDFILADGAFFKALDTWTNTFCKHCYNLTERQILRKKYLAERCKDLMITFWQLLMWVCKYESVVREFAIIMFHQMAITFQNEYKGKKVRHLQYLNSDPFDVEYFNIVRNLKKKQEEPYTKPKQPNKFRQLKEIMDEGKNEKVRKN